MRKKVKINKLYNDSLVPRKTHKYDAGFDLYAHTDGDVEILPHETCLIGTGIALELPKGTFGAIFARSGLASKKGLAPANKVGVVDSPYRGEVMVALHNHSSDTCIVSTGERIAQMIVMPYMDVSFKMVDKLSDTERGSGGFGSTGIK